MLARPRRGRQPVLVLRSMPAMIRGPFCRPCRLIEKPTMNARTPLVDLVPRGNGFYMRLFAGGAAIVALLEVGYAVMPLLASRTTDGRVAALDLDAEGS